MPDLVFIQHVAKRDGETWYEVVDRRMPTGQRIVFISADQEEALAELARRS